MFDDLILFHRPGGQGTATLAADLGLNPSSEGFFWQTCLRQIAISDVEPEAPILQEHDEIYRGDEAYRFILETICGLHSPMVGETEVYGQFKTQLASFTSPRGSRLNRVFKALLEDAKTIRLAHLEDLGSQTYGSVLRRELKGVRRTDVLGAGQFVTDLLPWVRKDGNETTLIVRDRVKAKAAFPGLRVRSMAEKSVAPEALLIAVPLSTKDLAAWLSAHYGTNLGMSLRFVADLRADSSTDPLGPALQAAGLQDVRVLELGDIFSRINANQEVLQFRKARALKAIEDLSRERAAHVEYRPFGWEDVCA